MQRAFDIAVALVAGVLLGPLWIAISLAIALGDGLPVLFRQTRGGLRGEPFTMLKFRTMSVAPSTETGTFQPGDTSRVTPVGRFLRRTKLDELPQLWNVMTGEMSIVGPRPEVPEWIDAYPEAWSRVHRVRPGITDPAAIVYRDEEEILQQSPDPDEAYRNEILPRKLELYEEYARERTLLRDVAVILRTIAAVLRSR